MHNWCLEVWGDYACFTRPEMKVERVSYDVITPSAARAIFEAILWKPAIRWNVTKIEILNAIKWISVRRNEVGKKIGPHAKSIFIEDEHVQRAGYFLKDVRYRIHGYFDYIPPGKRKANSLVPRYGLWKHCPFFTLLSNIAAYLASDSSAVDALLTSSSSARYS